MAPSHTFITMNAAADSGLLVQTAVMAGVTAPLALARAPFEGKSWVATAFGCLAVSTGLLGLVCLLVSDCALVARVFCT